jgi:hypothetical protein
MKRYWIRPSGSSTVFAQPHQDGDWVRAEDAKRLLDALMAQVELSEYWIHQYFRSMEMAHGPMSDNDFREWIETGYRSNAMRKSRDVLSDSASIASCSITTTDDQD